MTNPETPPCPFGQDVACALAVGGLASREMAVQTAYMDVVDGENNTEQTLDLAAQYEAVASGAFGLEVLDLAARALPAGVTCGAPCPLQRQINMRENMRGNPGV
jgi:hypothetical protein